MVRPQFEYDCSSLRSVVVSCVKINGVDVEFAFCQQAFHEGDVVCEHAYMKGSLAIVVLGVNIYMPLKFIVR
jgi:hypothetical protein